MKKLIMAAALAAGMTLTACEEAPEQDTEEVAPVGGEKDEVPMEQN